MRHESVGATDPNAGPPPLTSFVGVERAFGSNVVLDRIDFALLPGEIHALVGENGAGKSTRLGLLYGLHRPTAGQVLRDDAPVQADSPAHAQTPGIGVMTITGDNVAQVKH